MNNYSPQGFSSLTPVIKNLIILNVLFFLATIFAEYFLRIDLSDYLGLHYPKSHLFKPLQLVTYMFMHGGFTHILFNMFALWMFGNILENVWGPKKFLTYYFVTGIGAGIIQIIVTYFRLNSIEATLDPEMVATVYSEGHLALAQGQNFIHEGMADLNGLLNGATVGASGAVFGILLAFGMLFPNVLLYIYFVIPVKAKWFVLGYGLLELYFGMANSSGDNVAHFAHLGGMLFGFFLIQYWKKGPKNFL